MAHNTNKFARVFFLFILAALAMSYYKYRKLPRRIKEFQELTLDGIVTQIGSRKDGVKIKLNNEKDYHSLFSEYNYQSKVFLSDLVSLGDSMHKEKFGHYIYLFRKGKEYRFKATNNVGGHTLDHYFGPDWKNNIK